MVVAYDGTDFHGFAGQTDVRTVEGELTAALGKVLHGDVDDLACAGRTDAGVHAWGQVVSFDAAATSTSTGCRRRSTACSLPRSWCARRSSSIRASTPAARRSGAPTRYTIVNRPVPDPFLARYAWWVPETIDLAALRLGADPFVGEHDFAAFCRAGPKGTTTVRRVLSSRWVAAEDGVLRYEIAATAFCWQMVRSIVGTLVDVGTGKIRPGDLMRIIRSGDRAAAGRVAPPSGLCLWEVGY